VKCDAFQVVANEPSLAPMASSAVPGARATSTADTAHPVTECDYPMTQAGPALPAAAG